MTHAKMSDERLERIERKNLLTAPALSEVRELLAEVKRLRQEVKEWENSNPATDDPKIWENAHKKMMGRS